MVCNCAIYLLPHTRNAAACVGQVDLSEEEAKALFHQLDSDRDGALGAEDLLRGAPTVGKVVVDLRIMLNRDQHAPTALDYSNFLF